MNERTEDLTDKERTKERRTEGKKERNTKMTQERNKDKTKRNVRKQSDMKTAGQK